MSIASCAWHCSTPSCGPAVWRTEQRLRRPALRPFSGFGGTSGSAHGAAADVRVRITGHPASHRLIWFLGTDAAMGVWRSAADMDCAHAGADRRGGSYSCCGSLHRSGVPAGPGLVSHSASTWVVFNRQVRVPLRRRPNEVPVRRGTIDRKGIDILLEVYLRTFNADVMFAVISPPDDSVYSGLTVDDRNRR